MNGHAADEKPEAGAIGLRPVCEYKEDFDRVRELGRGKFGIVYEVKRAAATDNEERFAAKHIRARKRDVRERTLYEIDLLKQLRHPHVLSYVAAFESPTELVILTEYLSGGELFERVAAEQFDLTEAEVVAFMREICAGVKYLHEKQVAHLDLKPENIVCCEQSEKASIKIIDFGLARILKPGETVKVMSGTPEFVAPEVVNYDPISLLSDTWSLGVIAYVLLSGLSPFMGDTVGETYSNVSRAEYDFDEPEFEEISPDAKDFITALLVKDKQKRMSASQCLHHGWLSPQTKQPGEEEGEAVKIDKTNLRKYLARRRWQRYGQAIRAMKRMSTFMNLRRKSGQSQYSSEDETTTKSTEESSEKTNEEVAASREAEDDEGIVAVADSEVSECESEPAHFSYAPTYRSSLTIHVASYSE